MLLFVSAGQVNAFSSNARVGSRCGYRRVRPEVVAMAKGRDKLPEEGLVRPLINWYPGHIAKAEKKLKEMLSVVDVVIEMRDCRIPRSTAHPLVEKWYVVRPPYDFETRQMRFGGRTSSSSILSWRYPSVLTLFLFFRAAKQGGRQTPRRCDEQVRHGS